MEARFTPGPWIVTASMECGPVHDESGDVIVGYCAHNAGRMNAEQWANARLIAAAPEMYALLEKMTDCGGEDLESLVENEWATLRTKINTRL